MLSSIKFCLIVGKKNQQLKQAELERQKLEEELRQKEDEKMCVICEDSPINIVLVPCGHQIMVGVVAIVVLLVRVVVVVVVLLLLLSKCKCFFVKLSVT